jgi:hypothetical protein
MLGMENIGKLKKSTNQQITNSHVMNGKDLKMKKPKKTKNNK